MINVSMERNSCLLSALDADKRVLFASRHMCTTIDAATGKATYAPPHLVNYKALIWALARFSFQRKLDDLGDKAHRVELDGGDRVSE